MTLTGCEDDAGSPPEPGPVAESEPGAGVRFLIAEIPKGPVVSTLDRAGGTLAVNGRNCLAIDDEILLGFPGARMVNDGEAELSDGSTMQVGDRVSLVGSRAEFATRADVPLSYRSCLVGAGPYVFFRVEPRPS